MALAAGTRLGPYEVLGLVGAGGMGEVYKARDTRLDRSVAIKVLPADLAADAERRVRFEREARTISALTHPHICALYDVGDHEGVPYLVMEHLAGETLAARLAKGPLSLEQALDVGAQIAEALDAAHKHGIIHRDLKPANVMLSKAGAVHQGALQAKLLDFGLAKLRPQEGVHLVPDSSAAPTRTRDVTTAGTLVGTLPYMAPEQVEGREADARTDLWALGCLLYEMVTGQRAFAGATTGSLVGAILAKEPARLSALQPLTPPAFERLVNRCLAKDPDQRWDSAHDVADELRWISQALQLPGSAPTGRPHRARWALAVLGASLLLVGAGATASWMLARRVRQVPAQVHRFLVDTAPAGELGPLGLEESPLLFRASLALSPDGQTLAFAADQAGQPRRLFVRRTSELAASALPGTDGAEWPFFSPDGVWLGFWADGQLKKIRLDGGPPARVCQTDALFGASWAPDGTIVFAREAGPLMALPPASDQPRPLTRIPDGSPEVHRLPHVLPDGSGVIFTALGMAPFSLADWGAARVELLTLATGERRVLMRGAEDARYLPTGHLLYARGNGVEAVPFDLAGAKAVGAPVGLVRGVMRAVNTFNTYTETGTTQLAVSDSGTLVYVAGNIGADVPWRFSWVDLAGRLEPTAIPPGPFLSPSISPDGTRLAFRGAGTKPGLWVYDFTRSNLTRVNSEAAIRWPIWSRDGRQLVFSRFDEPRGWVIVRQDVGGGEEPDALCPGYGPASWSADGKTLVFTSLGADGEDAHIMLADLAGAEARVASWRRTPRAEWHPTVSPNGRWLAYTSYESGSEEVYVESFPEPGVRQKVSTAMGTEPAWAPKGDAIFFLSSCVAAQGAEPVGVDLIGTSGPERWCFFKVTFREGSPPALGRPDLLAEVPNIRRGSPNRFYDILPDGRRFLVTLLDPAVPGRTRPRLNQVHIVLNWFEELKAKVPAG